MEKFLFFSVLNAWINTLLNFQFQGARFLKEVSLKVYTDQADDADRYPI